MDSNTPILFERGSLAEGSIQVKGENEIVDQIFFEAEEKIVEHELKRPLTPTPEQYAATEKIEKGLSRYKIRQALLEKEDSRCKDCGEKNDDLFLIRVYNNENGDRPKPSDYVLLCEECFLKRNRNAKNWTHKPSGATHLPLKLRKGESKASFYNKIRKKVYERDNYKCVFCEALGKAKRPGRIGLTSLIPESEGGKLSIENFVCCCDFHRQSKSDELPVKYIWKQITFKHWLSEQLPDNDVTATPGGTVVLSIHLVGGLHQFLARISADESIEQEIRGKAERLAMRLSEGNDVRRDRKAKPLL